MRKILSNILGEIEKFVGEGMPQHEYSSFHGVIKYLFFSQLKDLFVEYRVNFPTQFTSEQLKRKILKFFFNQNSLGRVFFE